MPFLADLIAGSFGAFGHFPAVRSISALVTDKYNRTLDIATNLQD